MTSSDWTSLLQQGLQSWSQGDLDSALESLEFCASALQRQPGSELWQVLVDSCISHLQLNCGVYQQAEKSLARAAEVWKDQLFDRRWGEITSHFQWFEAQLHNAGLVDEAELYEMSRTSEQSLFLGGAQEDSPFGPASRRQEAAGVEASAFEIPTLAVQQHHELRLEDWRGQLDAGLSQAGQGRRQEMAAHLIEARAIAVKFRAQDRGLRLFWTSWLECLCCFLVGEYDQSDVSRRDAQDLWLGLSVLGKIEQQPPTIEACELLLAHGHLALVEKLADAIHSGRSPVIDPWRDVRVGLQTLSEVPLQVENLEEHWRKVIFRCCEALSDHKFGDVEARIATLKARFDGLPDSHRLPLLLLNHLFCVIAQRRGNYSFADSHFPECQRAWLDMPLHMKAEGPWTRIYQQAANEFGLRFLLENFPARLYDPQTQRHGMLTLSEAQPDHRPSASDDWSSCLLECWKAARQGKNDLAMREAVKAEQHARAMARSSRSLAFVLTTQSSVAFLMGNYQESGELARESQQVWGLSQEDASLDEFLSILVEADWGELAKQLRFRNEMGKPSLIEPDKDMESFGMSRWVPSEDDELGPLTLPEASSRKTGWLESLKKRLGG